jgi:hypothetical protein
MAETFGQYGRHRFWEMVPGVLVWSTLILAIVSSFFAPALAIIFIIIFDLYWTLRVMYFIIHTIAAYLSYRKTVKIDWYAELQKIKRWEDVRHVVMLPTYKEGLPILRAALQSVIDANYDNKKFIVVVGGEEGDQDKFNKHADTLKKEFNGKFDALLFTVHPRGLKGEIPGKGSNMKWMAEKLQVLIDKRGIPYKDIIVSAFDVDTIAHAQYFAKLAHLYLTEPDAQRSSYQPVVLFSNNIWSSSAPIRVMAFGTTFWLFGELVRPERLWTFSSHSMPWQMLVDVGFWEPDLVSEDSRIFLQGLIHYDGNYRVTPVFLPVSMDAVEAKGWWQAVKALYKQQRRWAWGVEHLPYMIARFKENKKIPFRTKFKFVFNHIEGMYTWGTAPILIFLLGYLPFFVARDSQAALVANSPFTLEFMMRIATIGIFATGILSMFLLPPRPKEVKPWNWLVMILQWALLPITFVTLGAFPAIDAQTRLMLGKYLGFNVTKKRE